MHVLVASLVLALASAAAAQAPAPAAPAAPAVQWKAQAKAGLVSTSGNARTTTVTAGANVSRSDPANKLTLDGVLAWGRSGIDPVEIHSARAFLGDTVKVSETVGVVGSLEALANLNEEDALDARDLGSKVTAFEDLRVNARLALTAALRGNVSLSVGFTLRWDRNPAPLPPIAGAPPYAPSFVPFAKEVDTVTDAALIVSFL